MNDTSSTARPIFNVGPLKEHEAANARLVRAGVTNLIRLYKTAADLDPNTTTARDIQVADLLLDTLRQIHPVEAIVAPEEIHRVPAGKAVDLDALAKTLGVPSGLTATDADKAAA